MRYQVVFEGKLKEGFTCDGVAKNLKRWLKINGQQTASLFSGQPVVVKQDLDLQAAVQFKQEFENSGAIGQVQAVINSEIDENPLKEKSVSDLSDGKGEEPKNGEFAVHRSRLADEKPKNGQSASPLDIQGLPLPISAVPFAEAAVGEEDDDETDDCEASFSLREKLSTFGAYDLRLQSRAASTARSIGVFKFRADAVIDVCYLNSKESYFINSNKRRFRLAQKNGSEKGYLYLQELCTQKNRARYQYQICLHVIICIAGASGFIVSPFRILAKYSSTTGVSII